MKIVVTATGTSLDAQLDPRFGRCAYFLVVETDDLSFEAIENPNAMLGGGAGIQSAQLMAEKSVNFVLTGNCGPNAHQVFSGSGIGVIIGCSGIVKTVIEQFKAGQLKPTNQPNVGSHSGMTTSPTPSQGQPMQPQQGGMMGGGMGMGRGGGRGMGRGMSQGRGMGRGMGRGGGCGTGRGMGTGIQNITPQSQPAQESSQDKQAKDKSNSAAVIDIDKCDGCGTCVEICPVEGIELVDEKAINDEEKCIECGACVEECPNDAISMPE